MEIKRYIQPTQLNHAIAIIGIVLILIVTASLSYYVNESVSRSKMLHYRPKGVSEPYDKWKVIIDRSSGTANIQYGIGICHTEWKRQLTGLWQLDIFEDNNCMVWTPSHDSKQLINPVRDYNCVTAND